MLQVSLSCFVGDLTDEKYGESSIELLPRSLMCASCTRDEAGNPAKEEEAERFQSGQQPCKHESQ